MLRSLKNKIIHNAFEVMVCMKGLGGILEIILGVFFLYGSIETIRGFFIAFTSHRIMEGPGGFATNYLIKNAHDFNAGTQHFLAFYFLFYGLCNLFLVVSLLKNKLWAYPVAMVSFVLFTLYMTHRFFLHYSGMLLFFIAFDIFLIALTWLEYQRVKKRKADSSAPSPS